VSLATGPSSFPPQRVRGLNEAPVRAEGDYVLYWMVATRRPFDSFALERAVDWARALGRPLLVLEALGLGYPQASPRVHRFVLQGMAANARAFAARGVRYLPWVEREQGSGRGLIEALAARAAVVVSDDTTLPFVARWQRAVAPRISARLELVDDLGLLPLVGRGRAAPSAAVFRRWLQRDLPPQLPRPPAVDPSASLGLPMLQELELGRWRPAGPALLDVRPEALAALPLDQRVIPVAQPGGHEAALQRWRRFLDEGLSDYAERRNLPGETSGLSSYLHFGQLSPWRLWADIANRESWDAGLLGPTRGQRAGWWGLSSGAEAFLDQAVTWRELSHHAARHDPDFFRYEGLPAWARATLEEHAGELGGPGYELEELEQARSDDPVWNAAQRQLLSQGRIAGYLRMIWGKRLLEWADEPRQAWAWMHTLNDRWALDGRGPNGTAGIAWVMGRFDRPWGPRRPVFGTVRFMSSARAARKLALGPYLERWGPQADDQLSEQA
jgi:deoxyribodipyrimidine photo-lyase